MVHHRPLALSLFLASLVLAFPCLAAAQATVYFRVEITASAGSAPQVDVKPFEPEGWSLGDRAAMREMWSSFSGRMTTVAERCEMPIAVEIDAGSFRGRLVAGTLDGLHPGTRARFQSLVAALTAICGRGALERGAVQQRVRAVRFGWTSAPTDQIRLEGTTLVLRTNGDMSGPGHLDYGPFLQWLEQNL